MSLSSLSLFRILAIALAELYFRRWSGREHEYEPRFILRYPSGEYAACKAGRDG